MAHGFKRMLMTAVPRPKVLTFGAPKSLGCNDALVYPAAIVEANELISKPVIIIMVNAYWNRPPLATVHPVEVIDGDAFQLRPAPRIPPKDGNRLLAVAEGDAI